MAGQTYKGRTFGPNRRFDNGNIFINCTFRAPCFFGRGCVFVNCTWRRRWGWSRVGEGGVVHKGTWNRVIFGPKVMLKSGRGLTYRLIGGSKKNNPGRSSGRGGNWAGAQIVMGSDHFPFVGDWDSGVRKDGYILRNKKQAGPIIIGVPEDLKECK